KETLLLSRLRRESRYRVLFAEALPDKARVQPVDFYSLSTTTQALASFQRTLLTFNSNYDRYKYGEDKNAISPAARRGQALFFSGGRGCYQCPAGLYFTDNIRPARMDAAEQVFHNPGLYNEDGRGASPPGHTGLAEFTGRTEDMGKFRTPSLRN